MHNFKNLEVWKKSMLLAKKVYILADLLPEKEKYGFYGQITRSAVSIPSNIAEGTGKSSSKDFKRYLEIALGSACELETQLILLQEMKLICQEISFEINLTCEIQKMLNGLIKRQTNR
jgi:four helix bundle protein